jgi:hypothetical protein
MEAAQLRSHLKIASTKIQMAAKGQNIETGQRKT